jgi:GNAT superfamily N-acetyltransferase
MIQESVLNLPQELGDGLLLRWGRPEDADALAAFNIRLHSDNADAPDEWLGAWTRDLLSGKHPTTSAKFFTVVEDVSSGAIVSSLVLIPQTWLYEDIPFGVGRPELIATDEAYRRRGLIRKQMEVAHALSAQMGHMVQAITGIPWFYRQFGYEMTINLGGGREFFWARPGNDKPQDKERHMINPAVLDDVPVLSDLYRAHSSGSLITRARNDEIWRYELEGADPSSVGHLSAYIIRDFAGLPVGYAVFFQEGAAFVVTEFGVVADHSWREVALFLTRELKRRADKLNLEREKPISTIVFPMADSHPLIKALGSQLEKKRNPYAWYMRVADLHAFVAQIKPVLERRLKGSVLAGHTGTLRLNLYRDTLNLVFEKGAITEIGRFMPKKVEDGDGLFPDLTFLNLLFCHRSYAELDTAHPDCYVNNAEAHILLDVLFPKKLSYIRALN